VATEADSTFFSVSSSDLVTPLRPHDDLSLYGFHAVIILPLSCMSPIMNPHEGRKARSLVKARFEKVLEPIPGIELATSRFDSIFTTKRRYKRTSISGPTFSGKKCLSRTVFHAI
jgi:hypothetical protein